MSEQIYMIEFIVPKIELQSSTTISDVRNLALNFKFVQLINFDVDTQYFEPTKAQDSIKGRIIDLNFGKTFLFISKPTNLRQLLQTDPYVLTLYDGTSTIGSVSVHWKREFGEMVKFFETLGIVKSTTVEDVYELIDEKGNTKAKINTFIRMCCFGSNVQTMFQIKKEGDKAEYIFRQRNASKTFKVQKHEDDRHQPLVAPLYNALIDAKTGSESEINLRENVSLTQLFERGVQDKASAYRAPDQPDEGIMLDFEDLEKLSMCYRPSENKFFDLLNLISADIKTHEKGTLVTLQKHKGLRTDGFLKSVGGKLSEHQNIVVEDGDETLQMTADLIAKKLCGNLDCPAVKKFKEYGIGPLATGKNLGTLYGEVEPPVTYGLSHAYGTFCEYGPYGVFSRPKHEELPFVPSKEPAPVPKPCRIPQKDAKKKKRKKKDPEWHSPGCPLCPSRLRGGSDGGLVMEQQQEPQLLEEIPEEEGVVMPKSPMVECKSVMDQFDMILAEYKKAIGPCGQATCPYAQTLAEDSCKRACDQMPPTAKKDESLMSCNDDPCDVDGCPYAETKKKRYPAGCGNPKCAYTKYKLGLVNEDAELELQFLPPAIGGTCGSPKCKYPLAPPLPPIHWDCPDPLPKGPCKNLNCPFLPPPLKKFKTKDLKLGPCGSPMCPYALPQPCGVPTCPFAMRPCPMTETRPKPKKKKCPPSTDEDNLCENPDCPFADKNASKEPAASEDPKFQGEFQDCVNPECPYKKPKKKKKKQQSSCGNPACPFANEGKKDKKAKKEDTNSEDISVCSNPDCFYNQKKKKSKKKKSSSESICSDPECPYAGYKMQKQVRKTNGDDGDGVSCSKDEEQSICSNPECPARKESLQKDPNICDQPDCPYSSKFQKKLICNDPSCPYLQPLPSCGVPNCPYEPIPLRFSCKNPVCPSKSVNFSKKIDRSKLGREKENSDQNRGTGSPNTETDVTAVVVKTTTVCEENTTCDEPEVCENPDCEMKEAQGKPGQSNKILAVSQQKKGRKRKNKGKFVYSIGDNYPGTKLGHRDCVMPVFNVPPNMGWLWNIFTPILNLKPRRGWRPGALTKTIAARIRAHRQAKGLGYLRVPTFRKDGTGYREGDDPKVVPKPTLQIQKKQGTYWITMNPLKDPYSLVENEDPYMECTPMTFKITKNQKPKEDYCYCDGEGDEDANSSSSSDSELDIEFTPPAGIIHPERFKKKPNVVCCEAQYDPKDFEVQKKKADKGKKGKDKGKGKGGKKGGKKKK